MLDASHPADGVEQRSEPSGARLWGQWVAANAIGELLGLGIIGLVAGLLASAAGFGIPGWVVLPGVLLLGTLEGVLVGTSQWLAIRRALPRLRASAWIRATAAGALLAWVLGMLPSTVMDMAASSGTAQEPPPEVSDAVQLLLACALGLVAGPILAGVQWRVLRRHVSRAGWWMPANSLAWALGMPLVFVAVGRAAEAGRLTLQGAVFGLGMIALAGAVVGMVHGLVLVQLLAPRRAAPEKTERASHSRMAWRSLEFKVLAILELLVGLNALVAGSLFIARPGGSLLGVSVAMLRGTPFHSFLIPGLLLALVVGGGLLVAAVLALRGHALADLASLLAGLVLMGWIVIQMALIGYWPPLQPIVFGMGFLIAAMGLAVRSQRGRPRRREAPRSGG